MTTLTQEKIFQTIPILKEYEIDCWITFVRETSAGGDPILPLIYGYDLTWQSAILVFRNGIRVAIVGHFEAETARNLDAFDEVIPYHQSIKPEVLSVLHRFNPETIAINFSENDVFADGLTYGMYLILKSYLVGTPWENKLVSAEKIIAALKGRKTENEVRRIKKAIHVTEEIFNLTFNFIKPGYSERQIAKFMKSEISKRNLLPAWDLDHCPTVNAGPDSPVGHVAPGDYLVKRGNIVHIDFGIKEDDYCSDIQRIAYVLNKGEKIAPDPVRRGFDTIIRAIQECVSLMKPGMTGFEVDMIARDIILKAGYPEYKYATGHQLGRQAHDGAGILGPRWERYGETPDYPVENGQVYTIEPGIAIPEYGYLGIEEDVIVTENGTKFLTQPQKEIIFI